MNEIAYDLLCKCETINIIFISLLKYVNSKVWSGPVDKFNSVCNITLISCKLFYEEVQVHVFGFKILVVFPSREKSGSLNVI